MDITDSEVQALFSERGRQRIRKLLQEYEGPQYNRETWIQKLECIRTELLKKEFEKSRIRKLYKHKTGTDCGHPPEYDMDWIPEVEDDTATAIVDGKTYGLFEERRVLLEYEGPTTWSAFKKHIFVVVEVVDIDPNNKLTEKIIVSLTLENLIRDCQAMGCSYIQLGRIVLDFLRAVCPVMAARINLFHKDTVDVLKVVNDIIDPLIIKREVQYVENSLKKVRREVGEDLSKAGNSYSGKLTVLWRLSGTTSDFAEIEKHVSRSTFIMMLELIHPEIKRKVMNQEIKRPMYQFLDLNLQNLYSEVERSELDLQNLYSEVERLEEEHPEWRLKSPAHLSGFTIKIP